MNSMEKTKSIGEKPTVTVKSLYKYLTRTFLKIKTFFDDI